MTEKERSFLEQIFTYFSVGGLATLIHVIVIALLQSFLELSVYIVNFFAFMVAFLFSYLGHYYFTFRSRKNIAVTGGVFLVLNFAAFLVSQFFMYLLVRFGVPDSIAVFMAALSIPFCTFFISKRFVF